MRELAILTFISTDGVMQAPKLPEEDTSKGFTLGGWANACWDDVMASVGRVAMSKRYDVLLGRRTYDQFSPVHGSGDSPLNALKKYVVTSRPLDAPWPPTTEVRGDAAAEIAKLKGENGPLLQVHGSHELIQMLLRQGLVDEYRIWTFPVLLGSGKRLFEQGTPPTDLVLQKSQTLKSGAVMSVYRNAN